MHALFIPPTCTHTSINIVLLCLISKLLASKQTFLGSFHWDLSYYYLEEIRVLVALLEAGLRFSKCITSLMLILVQLLASFSATNVDNTILFLMRCRHFQIKWSKTTPRKMLMLSPLISQNWLFLCPATTTTHPSLIRTNSKWFLIVIYAIFGCPLLYMFWYRPLYRAMRFLFNLF
jgi:hypothetical protein